MLSGTDRKKFIIAGVICLALAVCLAFAAGQSGLFDGDNRHEATVGDNPPIYTSYHDIPGVTEEEIDAIEKIKERRGEFAYGMNYSTEAFIDDGVVGGYSALFCELLSELFEIP